MPIYAPVDPQESMKHIGEKLQQWAASQPDKTALVDDHGQMTWAQLVSRANRIANRLQASGLQGGDTVAGLSENTADYMAVYLGTLIAGGCMVPLSGMASGDALALMIEDCGAR